MEEFIPGFHHFDVKDDDKYIVSIIRYQPDINEHGAVISSMQGFSNEKDASRTCLLLNDIIKFTRFGQPSYVIYVAQVSEKKENSFAEWFQNHCNLPIKNENDKIL